MRNQAEISIPAYLHELLQPTPSGAAKLIAAWDGLTPETQILMLAAKKKSPGPAYLYEQIIDKALLSDNGFVRYMAAREISFNDPDRQNGLRTQIANDAEALVRYAHLETDFGTLDHELEDPEKFFALPHQARLAKVRRLTGSGESVAKLIAYAVQRQMKDGRVSERELFEILSDYLNKSEFKNRYVQDRLCYDGLKEYSVGQELEALWQLVLNVPESLSRIIIEHLPESGGLSTGIPKHVLDGMSDRQLRTLFYRPDIGLEEFRKQKFFETLEANGEKDGSSREGTQCAAVSFAFDLTDDEFAMILAKPDERRVRTLRNLSMMAQGLRLCLYEAIHDALFASEVSSSDYVDAEFAKRTFEGKLRELKGWQREKQLRELKLYRLAVQAVPWKMKKEGYPPSGELAFLQEAVVDGDTWATFIAFCREWDEARFLTKRLERRLPKIWEAGEEEGLALDEEEIGDADRLADRVANKLADLLATAHGETEEGESKLAQALGRLGVHATVAQEKTLEAVNSVKAELAQLSCSQCRQRAISWTVMGLLVVLLFVGR